MHRLILLVLFLLAACNSVPSGAKRKSQPAMVVQRIGAAKVTVTYNRPSARGRALFGGIVPWDSVWDPGADEATKITTTRDLLVEGHVLRRGEYSLWAVPGPAEWTVIFSRAADVYHTPYPGAYRDALRLRVRPQRGPHVETLAFWFPVATADSAVLALHWGETIVPLRLHRR